MAERGRYYVVEEEEPSFGVVDYGRGGLIFFSPSVFMGRGWHT